MSQISPPLRIALVAAIAFLGVWTMFLRPTAEEPVATPDVSAAGRAVAGANLAAANADARAEALAGGAPADTATATGSRVTAAEPSSPTAQPARLNRAALAKLPDDVARAVRQDKVIALLFWNSDAPDDRRVRRSLRQIGRDDGKVFVKAAAIEDISRYAPITRGADVQQSPTLVVVDRDLQAESLVGYVARTTIRQALSDAARAGR